MYETSQLISLLAFSSYISLRFLCFRGDLADEKFRVLAVAQQERQRLARDLHDGVGQEILAARMSLQLLARQSQEKRTEASLENALQDAMQSLSESLDQVRALSRATHPAFGSDFSLKERVERYLRQLTQLSNADFELQWECSDDCLDPRMDGDVFRVIQEATTNALRHGEADGGTVKITILKNEKKCSVEIVGGRPFDPEAHAGIGWTAMQGRAEEHGGTLMADVLKGRARVVLRLPLG